MELSHRMRERLTPVTETPPRPAGPERDVVRSHLVMRALVGALGVALPIVLVVGDMLFLDPEVSARGSLSAYYHSGVRDVFVAIMVASGLALITYKRSPATSTTR